MLWEKLAPRPAHFEQSPLTLSMEYRWAKEAYFKVAFHASKFLTSPLFGLLLGHKSEANSQQVLIVDSIPLFHTSPVASSLEIALLEVRIFRADLFPP